MARKQTGARIAAVAVGVTLMFAGATAIASVVSISPSIVVRDNNGEVLAPVVGYQTSARPLVMFSDPTSVTPRGILVHVRADVTLVSEEDFRVFYDMADCNGTPYLALPGDRVGVPQITGVLYAIGLNTLDQVVLLRTNGPAEPVDPVSEYQAQNADFTSPQSGCTASSFGVTSLMPATEIINFTVDHPPPYSVEFPGLD